MSKCMDVGSYRQKVLVGQTVILQKLGPSSDISAFINFRGLAWPVALRTPYTMSDNVGLSTPRGSGTSGYVQKNRSLLRHRDKAAPYPKDWDSAKHRPRQPDAAILEHEAKRAIEVKVLELRDKLEDEGCALRPVRLLLHTYLLLTGLTKMKSTINAEPYARSSKLSDKKAKTWVRTPDA